MEVFFRTVMGSGFEVTSPDDLCKQESASGNEGRDRQNRRRPGFSPFHPLPLRIISYQIDLTRFIQPNTFEFKLKYRIVRIPFASSDI